jgi:hypothetical protein
VPAHSARLTAEDTAKLIAAFQAGTAKRELAARFEIISESSVKRVLRDQKVRRCGALEERLARRDGSPPAAAVAGQRADEQSAADALDHRGAEHGQLARGPVPQGS